MQLRVYYGRAGSMLVLWALLSALLLAAHETPVKVHLVTRVLQLVLGSVMQKVVASGPVLVLVLGWA